jgi:hypothetical protein
MMNEAGPSSLMASAKAPEPPAMAQIIDRIESSQSKVYELASQLRSLADLTFGERPEVESSDAAATGSGYSGAIGAALDNLRSLDRSIDFLADQVRRLRNLA